MKSSAIRKNLKKEAEGVWVADIPNMEDLRLKVRPANNPDFRQLYSQLVASLPRQYKRAGVVTDKVKKDEILARCLADTVLLDWENYDDDDGRPISCTPEIVKPMLLDPEYAAMRDAVAYAADVAEAEVLGAADENAGN